jgi:hypothetical protein
LADFSVSDAAFTGFRVVWERPIAAAIWAVIFLVTSLSFSVFITLTSGPALMRLLQLQQSGALASTDPAQTWALISQLLPMYGVLTLFSLIFYPVLYAAMNRAVLRPRDDAFGYLRLGGDELRQLWLLLIYAGMFLAAYFVLILLVGLAAAIGMVAGGGGAGEIAAVLIPAILIVGVFCGLVVLAVRLSLASAITFATKKLNPFGSWTLTRGRFWPMLGAYLLALFMAVIVWLLVFAVSAAAAAIAGGGNPFPVLFAPDMSSPAAYFSPARIAYLVLSAASSALLWPLLLTPAVTIYQRLAPAHGLPTGADGSISDVFA